MRHMRPMPRSLALPQRLKPGVIEPLLTSERIFAGDGSIYLVVRRPKPIALRSPPLHARLATQFCLAVHILSDNRAKINLEKCVILYRQNVADSISVIAMEGSKGSGGKKIARDSQSYEFRGSENWP
jgi:hypothetical protein